MSYKQHFDSIARRPAAEQPAAIHAETGPAATTENKVKVRPGSPARSNRFIVVSPFPPKPGF
jgi:hypothetical protein